jgi:hypothetical protein
VVEEIGSAILRDALGNGYTTAVSIEKSGQQEFDFAYREDFAQHIEAVHPTFARVLVRKTLKVTRRSPCARSSRSSRHGQSD